MKQIGTLIKKMGWSGWFIIGLFIVIYAYMLFQKKNRIDKASYAKGISLGIVVGVHGNHTLDYTFTIEGDDFKGFVPSSFCDDCPKYCVKGDTVIVRYETGNPKNNDLVK
jgi:hypothetical protein